MYAGRVYNVGPFLRYHPGGVGEMMRGAGKDGELFRLLVFDATLWLRLTPFCSILFSHATLQCVLIPKSFAAVELACADRCLALSASRLTVLAHAWVNYETLLENCLVGFLVPEPSS